MKNKVSQFFNLTVLLFLACSFVNKPIPAEAPASGWTAAGNAAVGGAYLFFAGKYGGDITKQEMTGHTEVNVEGCAKGSRIFNFTLTITKGKNTSTYTNASNVLSTEMRDKLNSLSKGDAFEFRHVKAYMPNGKDVVDVRGSKFVVV